MTDSAKPDGASKPEQMMIDVVIRLTFLGLLAYWAGLLVGPFVVIVIWAGILTVTLLPVYNWLKKKLGKGSYASFLITLVLLAIILGPAAVLTTSLVESGQNITEGLEAGTLHVPPPSESVKEWPVIGEKTFAAWSRASNNLTGFVKQHAAEIKSIASGFLSAAAGVGGGVLSFAVSTIISAFLYGRSESMAHSIGSFAERIVRDRGREFVAMSGATIRNVARGVLGVSLIQAVLAGIGLIVGGVPAAGLLALLILILGIVQAPPTLIIIPAIIWFWTDAEFLTALIFTIYMVPVALLDNFLKPILMAKGLKTPMLVIFIGVIGGTLAHGLIGLFLGPIILAVFYDLLTTWVTGEMPAPDEDEGAAEATRETA